MVSTYSVGIRSASHMEQVMTLSSQKHIGVEHICNLRIQLLIPESSRRLAVIVFKHL